MTSTAEVLLPIDVVVVDPDLLWRVEHMNAIKGVMVKEFASLEDATNALSPDHASVVVTGPHVDEQLSTILPGFARSRPDVGIVSVTAAPADVEAHLLVDEHLENHLRTLEEGTDPHLIAEAALDLLPVQARIASIRHWDAPTSPESPPPRVQAPERQLPVNLIVVTAAKAGEGTTTVAANLAADLARRPDLTVALVDGDAHFGDLGLMLGQQPRHLGSLDSLDATPDGMGHLISRHVATGLLVGRTPASATPRSPRSASDLTDLLAALASRADVVVLDAPFPVVVGTDLHRNAAAVVLVTSERTTSLKNAMAASRELSGAAVLTVVINSTTHSLREPDPRDVERALGTSVLGHVPYDGRIERASHRLPPSVIATYPSKLPRVFHAMVDELLKRAPVIV